MMPLTPQEQARYEELRMRDLEEREAEELATMAPAKPERPARMPEPDVPVSWPEATARGLADVLTFGTAKYTAPAIRGGLEAILPKSASEALGLDPYEVEKERYREREKIAQQYEGGSYGAGQGLGFGLQLVGAPFAGAASGARALAGRAFESPAGQAIVGGIQRGAETGFDPSEVGIGALTGGALSKLGTEATKAAQPRLEKMAASRAAKATGADIVKPSREIARLPGGREAYGKDVLKQGIVTAGKTVPEIAEEAKRQSETIGKQIGNIYKKLDLVEGGQVPEDYMTRLLDRLNQEVFTPLQEVAATRGTARRLQSQYLDDLQEMVKEGYRPSYQKLHKEQQKLGKAAYSDKGFDSPVREELRQVSRIMREELQNQASQTKAGADLIEQLREANRRYSVAQQAASTATQKSQRMATNRQLSLSDYLTGGIGATAGGFTGGGVGTLVGTAAGALVNKIARERGPQAAAAALNAAQKFAKGDPEKVGVFLNFLLSDQFTGGNEQ